MSAFLMSPLVVIATLNWNRPDDTLACLGSAAAQTYPNIKLVVVDNGSTDTSAAQIALAFPRATLICNQHNAGFAAGSNLALRCALELGAAYVFLINNDTILAPDCVERLLEHAAPSIGLVVPAIFYAAQPHRPWSLGGMRHPLTFEKTGDSPRALDRAKRHGTLDRDYVVGCALLFSRAVIEHVGVFDERFFMYYEDMDLSLRIRQHGWRIVLAPEAHMWHKVATSSGGSDSPNERYWMARSSILFFRKHVRGVLWLFVVASRGASAVRTSIRLVRAGRRDSLVAYWRGLRDGLWGRPCA